MGLYHVELGLPKGFNSKIGTVMLTYSNHAHNEARADRYGSINLPRSLNTNKALCFEVELIDGRVVKLAYRVAYSTTHDLILICRPKGNLFIISTVWLNLKSDKHDTLDLSKYETAA